MELNKEVQSFTGMLPLPYAECGNYMCSSYGKNNVSILNLNHMIPPNRQVDAHSYSLTYYKCNVCGHVDFIRKDNGRERKLLEHILLLKQKEQEKKESRREYYKHKKK
jgi:hypothetical protein